MFDSPSIGGETLKPADVQGHLLIVRPVSHEQNITTGFGVKDAVRVNVVDLDGTDPDTNQPGHVVIGALWFSGLLVGSLKNDLGKTLLGRMNQGVAKPGQSAPWKFDSAVDDQAAVQRASAWMNAHPGVLDGLAPPTNIAAPQPAANGNSFGQQPTVAAPQPAAAPPAPAGISPEAAAALAQLTPEQKQALGIAV